VASIEELKRNLRVLREGIMQAAKELKELIDQLPPGLQQEVQDFVEFLLEKRARKPKRKSQFDWARALRDLRDHYSSVEVQHKIAEWRIGRD